MLVDFLRGRKRSTGVSSVGRSTGGQVEGAIRETSTAWERRQGRWPGNALVDDDVSVLCDRGVLRFASLQDSRGRGYHEDCHEGQHEDEGSWEVQGLSSMGLTSKRPWRITAPSAAVRPLAAARRGVAVLRQRLWGAGGKDPASGTMSTMTHV